MLRLPGEGIAFVPMDQPGELEPVYSESDITIKSNRHVFLSGNPFTASQTSRQNQTVTIFCAGGHSGPPLRGGFVSIRGISKNGPNAKQNRSNARRHRHARDTSTA